ncbi:MAG: hypothetical protein HYY13_06430 [Nitrospirae bacterium]|nr:hypothetical protein [Nitrospirota bacterium]
MSPGTTVILLWLIQWSSLISGDANQLTLMRAGRKVPLELMAELKEKDTLEFKGGGATIFFSPDRFVTFKGSGTLVLADQNRWKTEGDLKAEEEKVADKGLAKVFSKETATAIGGAYFRSGGLLTRLAYPVSVAVEEVAPSFRWREKTVGKVILNGPEGKAALWESPVAGTGLDYPSGSPPLRGGQSYCWELTDAKGASLETACFRVVDDEGAKNLAAIRYSIETADPARKEGLCRVGVSYLVRESRLDAARDLLEACPSSGQVRTIKDSVEKRLGL